MTAASAYPPQSTDQGGPDVRSQEPSMEDILASIRRIIADDQSQGTRPGLGNGGRKATGSQASTSEADKNGARARTAYDDVLDLARLAPAVVPDQGPKPIATERAFQSAEPAHASSFSGDDAPIDEPFQHIEPDHFAQPPAQATATVKAHEPELEGRQDERTDLVTYEEDPADDPLMSEVLGASVMSAFETLAATVVLQNTPMLEGVMRDLLRPLLKTWLDDNLPALVERLVRTEIERVARGSRG